MRRFTYVTPSSLDQAVSLHESHGERARYIAGGTDILIKIKEKKISPDYLISLKHILRPDRPLFNRETGELMISAFVTHRMIETSPVVIRHYPVLHDAVKNIGSVQIRNIATIGGNLVNAVPSADGAIPLIALDAKVNIHGPKGERSMELLRFFLGPGQCDLEGSEILNEIVIPPLLPRTGSAYIKFGRREAMELPLLGAGVLISMDEEMKTCIKARIALGVAAPTPMRAFEAERFLKGKPVNEEVLTEAGNIAARESRVRDSIRGVAWYRREMVGILVKRMGLKCMERIKDQGRG
ncbi:MAG: xanthine dehydrogenase family protein subunit M [Thermodesulfobacteriota bacterium]